MEYTNFNKKVIDSWSSKYSLDWMKPISHEEYMDAVNNKYSFKLTPVKTVPSSWLLNIKGKKVLGLAAGGGQQMAILSALGAKCTLLDISKEQINKDILVSKRENYEIKIIEGDMTKPLPFSDEEFDMVINPVSNHYVEDVKPIFKEIYRVLKKGGTFIGGFDTGIYWIFDSEEEKVINKLPFNPLKNKEIYDELINNDMGLQFSHTLEEQIEGQLEAGFVLKELYEDTNPSGNLHDKNVPTFIATRCIK